jgi:hypothetical protein
VLLSLVVGEEVDVDGFSIFFKIILRKERQRIFLQTFLYHEKMSHDQQPQQHPSTNMKTVAVFGAPGVTGTHFVDKALSNGWNVRCLARSALKEKVGQTVVIGQVMDANDVENTLTDNGKPVDAVVVALGHNRVSKTNPWSAPTTPVNLIETAMGHIVKEMIHLGIKRLVYSRLCLNPTMSPNFGSEEKKYENAKYCS